MRPWRCGVRLVKTAFSALCCSVTLKIRSWTLFSVAKGDRSLLNYCHWDPWLLNGACYFLFWRLLKELTNVNQLHNPYGHQGPVTLQGPSLGEACTSPHLTPRWARVWVSRRLPRVPSPRSQSAAGFATVWLVREPTQKPHPKDLPSGNALAPTGFAPEAVSETNNVSRTRSQVRFARESGQGEGRSAWGCSMRVAAGTGYWVSNPCDHLRSLWKCVSGQLAQMMRWRSLHPSVPIP